MGRPETDIDPGQGPTQQFASELRKLRREAGGITYRRMARQAEFSAATLSRAAAGEQLPSLPVMLAYVGACGGDPQQWEQRWREAAAAEARQKHVPSDDGEEPPPYRGLARFDVGDADVFFGRDELTEELLREVGEHRVVVVFGPSGSGKSSLLRAGLIPRLRDLEGSLRPAAVRILTPGECPSRTHGRALAPAPGEGDTWLVVDQFEEVFTLCHEPGERADFIAQLLAAHDPATRLRVVLGVRADFYPHCLADPGLEDAVRRSSLPVGTMDREGLRAAIVKPAQAAGVSVERALTARLVDEVEGEPGGLPLLSHVLRETWRRRRARLLTVGAYEASGGLRGAVAQTAEEIYTGLSGSRQEVARQLFLRLISPGEGSPDTRRPVRRDEWDFHDEGAVAAVLAELVRARLVTVDDDTVDLAHEALITAWPRLHAWIEEDRQRLITHRRLTDAARAWDELARDAGALYRGTRLATAEEQLGSPSHGDELNELERCFLAASSAERDRERARAARTTRRLRGLTVGLSLLLVLALTAGLMAWRQSETNDRQRLRAEAQRLASFAETLRFSDPRLAMRLSVAAWRIAETPETRSAVVSSLGQRERDVFSVPTAERTGVIRLSEDGHVVINRQDDRVTAWKVSTRRARTVRVAPNTDDDVIPSPDGKMIARLATGAEADSIQVWDMRSGKPLAKRRAGSSIGELSFGRGGRTLLTSGFPGTSDENADIDEEGALHELWDVRLRKRLFKRVVGLNDRMVASDRLVAWCPERGGALKAWDVRADAARTLHGKGVDTACRRGGAPVFGTRTVAVADDTGVRRWDTDSGRELPRLHLEPPIEGRDPADEPRAPLDHIVFSDDNRFVAGASDEQIVLWRADRPKQPVWRHPLDHDQVEQLALDVKGGAVRYLGTGGPTGDVVRTLDIGPAVVSPWRPQQDLWPLLSANSNVLVAVERHRKTVDVGIADRSTARRPRHVVTLPKFHDESLYGITTEDLVSLSADGRLLAFARHDRVSVWDAREQRVVRTLKAPGTVWSVALSPDGTRLAATRDKGGEIWDVDSGRRLGALAGKELTKAVFRADNKLVAALEGGEEPILFPAPSGRARRMPSAMSPGALVFSKDSRFLALGSLMGDVYLWDARGEKRLRTLPGVSGGDLSWQSVAALAFSPDGSRLAVAGVQGALQVWDTETGRQIGGDLLTSGDWITSVAFGPDGTAVDVAGRHTLVRRYTVTADNGVPEVCRRAAGGPTRAQWARHIPGVPYQETC
ncbi:helix-turn-helix domain-containing protein [Streptomyces sp. NPDC127108]|uniref:nSTAND1 domain-containing NTPase n=1 Tax=Streptomyces sp. NPDC127108 TaxID=3345361 RepID=UPI003640D25D